ncbi:unnamed protein product [Mycena citricolor]|uniref:AA9 family lytic polysaccharide monooxygenase n=1 Tax=Mycena citricolor TaxID=2018698 RepID=A0AAD2HEZ6_9AGAR|nr:unnamed protein product [Mycena citricolor]
MYKASSPAYVLSSDFDNNSKMACEGSARAPAPQTMSVSAGEEIEIYWEGATSELRGQPGTGSLTAYNPWVHAFVARVSHPTAVYLKLCSSMGFVFDYITSCNGPCTNFDATNAGWTKLAHAGIDMSQTISSGLRQTMTTSRSAITPPVDLVCGGWPNLAIQNGSKWCDHQDSSSLKSGQYLIRHELGAVHNPKTSDPTSGPQLYIACIQLDVKNGGDATLPAGTQAKDLYLTNGAFANTNVLDPSFNPANVRMPGPPIWNGVSASGHAHKRHNAKNRMA